MKPFLFAVALLVGGITWISSRCSSSKPWSLAPSAVPKASFQCAGKQHCSQMGSKEEAQFYLASCPDVKVDGDGDGDACEEQFGH